MVPSAACLDLIKRFEGLRCSAYLDPVLLNVGIRLPTIGYGHTRGVALGQTCSTQDADAWLQEDVHYAVSTLDPYVSQLQAVNLQQCQFDALCSILFNVGPGWSDSWTGTVKGRDGIIWLAKRDQPAKTTHHSTLFRSLMNRDFQVAADEFLKWNHAGGVVLPGLTARRAAERALFLSTGAA